MISLKKLLTKLLQAAPPVGTISSYAGASDPSSEWAICDGRALSRTTYATLFGIIGTTYGSGDGSSTFNIPDLQGRVAVGRLSTDAAGTAVNFKNLGDKKGSKYLQSHNHGVSDPSHTHSNSITATGRTGGAQYFFGGGTVVGGGTMYSYTGISINNNGSGDSENIQPSLVVNYIIYLG